LPDARCSRRARRSMLEAAVLADFLRGVGLRPVKALETVMSRVIPYELARLRGNLGKRKLRPGPKPASPEAVPEPLPFLCEAAREEWRRLAPELFRLGLLTVLDHAIFGAYCAAFGHWMTAERLLETEGLTARGSTGNTVVHPLTKIATQAARDLCKYAAGFGMTPCARARMRAGWDPDAGGGPGKFDGLLA
jgi:P27 family predicted phage terminase small subunit